MFSRNRSWSWRCCGVRKVPLAQITGASRHRWLRGANTDCVHHELLSHFCRMHRIDGSAIRMGDDRATRTRLLRHLLDHHRVQRMENVDGVKLRVQPNGSQVDGIIGYLQVCEKIRTQQAGYSRTEFERNLQRDGGKRAALELRDTIRTGLQRKHGQYWRRNGYVALEE